MNHKIYIKTNKGIIHLCTISYELWQEFINTVGEVDVVRCIPLWAKEDFSLHIALNEPKDVRILKSIILSSCQEVYSELYTLSEYGIEIQESFWVTFWVASHLKLEVTKHEL